MRWTDNSLCSPDQTPCPKDAPWENASKQAFFYLPVKVQMNTVEQMDWLKGGHKTEGWAGEASCPLEDNREPTSESGDRAEKANWPVQGWLIPTCLHRTLLGLDTFPIIMEETSLFPHWELNPGLLHARPVLYHWATPSSLFFLRQRVSCLVWPWTVAPGLKLVILLSQSP